MEGAFGCAAEPLSGNRSRQVASARNAIAMVLARVRGWARSGGVGNDGAAKGREKACDCVRA